MAAASDTTRYNVSRIDEIGEDEVIRLFAGDDKPGLVVDNGDDAAAWQPTEGLAQVATTDSLVQSIHFEPSWSPWECTGRKLVSVSLSDLAAMGARPRHALVSVHLPGDMSVEDTRALGQGIRQRCEAHSVIVAGGNVTKTKGPVVLSLTMIGEADPQSILRRAQCRLGDALYVTGHLGDARGGLMLALAGEDGPLMDALIDPEPRVSAGRALMDTGVIHSMCDVSDGLARDVRHLLHGQALGAVIQSEQLPVSQELRRLAEARGMLPHPLALAGGEDYELLFSAPPGHEETVNKACESVGVSVTRIGEIVEGVGVEFVMPPGIDLPAQGFDHFSAP